jgi:outer membrane lipoprotein-sorting protein
MKPLYTLIWSAVVCLLVGACKSTEPSEALSREEALIQQHIEAVGGLEALRAVETVSLTGESQMPSIGMTLPLTVYQKRPEMMRIRVEVPGMGAEVINAYDGEVAWESNPMQGGIRKVTGEQERTFKEQADIDGMLVDHAAKGYEVMYAGEAEVRGAPAHKLRVVRQDSSETFIFLDAASHLAVKTESMGTNPTTGGTVKIETYLGDYRDVGGIMIAHDLEVQMDGDVFQRIKVESVEVNAELDDDLFMFPGS